MTRQIMSNKYTHYAADAERRRMNLMLNFRNYEGNEIEMTMRQGRQGDILPDKTGGRRMDFRLFSCFKNQTKIHAFLFLNEKSHSQIYVSD